MNMWVGLLGDHIIGSYLIEGNLNAERYLNLLENAVLQYIRNLQKVVVHHVWFQQDGCLALNAVIVRRYLQDILDNPLITGWSAILWPFKLFDLAPSDLEFILLIACEHTAEALSNIRRNVVDRWRLF
ncbi:hypothetical protein Trydic_g6564 [Trypoxylus dichotomus]